jgi:hypothetical protein
VSCRGFDGIPTGDLITSCRCLLWSGYGFTYTWDDAHAVISGLVWFCFGVSGLTVRWDDGNGVRLFMGFPLLVYQMYMWARMVSLYVFLCLL